MTMFSFTNKADISARIHYCVKTLSSDPELGIDAMKSILLYSGILVEISFLFADAQEALEGSFARLANDLGCEPMEGVISERALPPSTIVDFDTEHGRAMAREFFEEWLDCAYEFHDMIIFLIQQDFIRWENMGQGRSESFRLLVECTYKAMSYELAAQELCDAVMETLMISEGWSFPDCISGLSGLAGRKLALSHNGKNRCCWFNVGNLPDILDQTAYVMTQEAVRLGLPSGSDWRFGLPANDTPVNPPSYLISRVDPICRKFFDAINMRSRGDQAVACAKAAGRMLAVAAGGEAPQLEPALAKPLAMAAITESYKGMCVEYAFGS